MKVVEIFKSIEGEGIRAGYPATFIRFYNCDLHCSYCDSNYANEGGGYNEMPPEEIFAVVKDLGCNRLTVTGGEPMIQPGIYQFLESLSRLGYEINVETNGATPIRIERIPNLFFTMDYKSISSGMNGRMSPSGIETLINTSWFGLPNVLKFVVGNQEDLIDMQRVILSYEELHKWVEIFVSPVFGQIEMKEIVEFLLEKKLHEVKLQVQLHKIVWPFDMRGV